jgi:lambda family phage minor tail protein L
MRTLDAAVIAEKNKQENQPIHLFTVYDYDGAGTNLYLAQYDTNITFNGIEYRRFPVSFDGIGENNQGQINTVVLKVSNISREIQAYLELYDWRGKRVDITLVWGNQLADPDAKMTDTLYIDSYAADEENAEFTLSTKFDVLDFTLPGEKYLRNNCRWKFKSTECGYAGAETTCNRTFIRCQVLGNRLRYGGFPSIPINRIYVG